jgi:hypothetical protein
MAPQTWKIWGRVGPLDVRGGGGKQVMTEAIRVEGAVPMSWSTMRMSSRENVKWG